MKTIKVFCLWSQAFSSPKCQPSIAPKIPPCVTQNNVPYVPKPAPFLPSPPPGHLLITPMQQKAAHRAETLSIILTFNFLHHPISLTATSLSPPPFSAENLFFGAPFTHPSSVSSSCTNSPPCLLVNYS